MLFWRSITPPSIGIASEAAAGGLALHWFAVTQLSWIGVLSMLIALLRVVFTLRPKGHDFVRKGSSILRQSGYPPGGVAAQDGAGQEPVLPGQEEELRGRDILYISTFLDERHNPFRPP